MRILTSNLMGSLGENERSLVEKGSDDDVESQDL
jgi:hypothetical protein